MVKRALVFILAFFLGLVIQGAVIRSLLPSIPAPDFILVLVFYIALYFRTPWGVISAFGLGLAADAASGQFLGPQAAGCVVAFLVVLFFVDRIYAERGFAVVVVAFAASLGKSITCALLLCLYAKIDILTGMVMKTVLLEAIFSALLAPVLFWILRLAGAAGSAAVDPMRRTR